MSDEAPTRVIATTDVHSHLGQLRRMLATLEPARTSSLIVDCGDFFEGTGYHRLGGGVPEIKTLSGFYDVMAPGNHGFLNYLAVPSLYMRTVCANIRGQSRLPIFAPVKFHTIGGVRVGVAGAIGTEAFHSIPAIHRRGLTCQDPAEALTTLYRRNRKDVDAWIVLSHSGWDVDVKLAEACPFLDVIFSGHCHSDSYGPADIDGVTVVKGSEYAAGYSWAEPTPSGWSAGTADFARQGDAELSPTAAKLASDIADLDRLLSKPVGSIRSAFRYSTPERQELLRLAAIGALLAVDADAVLFNETAMQPRFLGRTLTRGDVMALAPFANELVTIQIRGKELPELSARLAERLGPVVVEPRVIFDSARLVRVVTTAYLAETHMGLPAVRVNADLADMIARALTVGPSL